MEESLEYLLNYKVRVSGIIFKLDPDNKEKRILTVQENSLYGLPGGKLPVLCMKKTKDMLDLFITKNKERLHNKLEEEKGKFTTEKEIIQNTDNEELRSGLESELYEELGLSRRKEEKIHIKNITPYTIYIEKLYSDNGILINPVYFVEYNIDYTVEIANPDIFIFYLEERKRSRNIKDYKLGSPLEITSQNYNDTFEHSVNRVCIKLQEDNLLNGKKSRKSTKLVP